jgi:hypothetical protein
VNCSSHLSAPLPRREGRLVEESLAVDRGELSHVCETQEGEVLRATVLCVCQPLHVFVMSISFNSIKLSLLRKRGREKGEGEENGKGRGGGGRGAACFR